MMGYCRHTANIMPELGQRVVLDVVNHLSDSNALTLLALGAIIVVRLLLLGAK